MKKIICILMFVFISINVFSQYNNFNKNKYKTLDKNLKYKALDKDLKNKAFIIAGGISSSFILASTIEDVSLNKVIVPLNMLTTVCIYFVYDSVRKNRNKKKHTYNRKLRKCYVYL